MRDSFEVSGAIIFVSWCKFEWGGASVTFNF